MALTSEKHNGRNGFLSPTVARTNTGLRGGTQKRAKSTRERVRRRLEFKPEFQYPRQDRGRQAATGSIVSVAPLLALPISRLRISIKSFHVVEGKGQEVNCSATRYQRELGYLRNNSLGNGAANCGGL